MFILGLTRIFRHIKYLILNFIDFFTWEYESCEKCGQCYRLHCHVDDDLWLKVYGSELGTLCPHCFLRMAEKKNIKVREDKVALALFSRTTERVQDKIKITPYNNNKFIIVPPENPLPLGDGMNGGYLK
jgi:hypothetical protein